MSESVVSESVETLAEVLKAHRYEAGSGGRICSCGAIGRPDPGSITTLQAVHMDHLAAELIASGAVRPAAEVRAEAWDEGYEAGYDDRLFEDRGLSSDPDADEYPHENPYRAALAEGGGDRD